MTFLSSCLSSVRGMSEHPVQFQSARTLEGEDGGLPQEIGTQMSLTGGGVVATWCCHGDLAPHYAKGAEDTSCCMRHPEGSGHQAALWFPSIIASLKAENNVDTWENQGFVPDFINSTWLWLERSLTRYQHGDSDSSGISYGLSKYSVMQEPW